VPSPANLFPAIWSLGAVPDGDIAEREDGDAAQAEASISDGTAVWFAATQQGNASVMGGGAEGRDGSPLILEAVPSSELADEALRVWLHFFAGHPEPHDTTAAE